MDDEKADGCPNSSSRSYEEERYFQMCGAQAMKGRRGWDGLTNKDFSPGGGEAWHVLFLFLYSF